MRKVKNKKTVTKIALRSLRARGSRNLIAVSAIILTSVLFTALFTIGGSLVEKSQESTFRQVGGRAHAGYKYLTKEEAEKVMADKEIKEASFRIAFADATNGPLKKVRTEMGYYEELEAKMSFCYPEEGTLPKEKYDFAASTLTLEALGVPCKLGEKAVLTFTLDGKEYEQEFTLSGWFTGDPVSMSQVLCLSKEYVEELAPSPTTPYGEGESMKEGFAGRYNVDVMFKSSIDIEGQLDKLSERLGFENKPTGVNWAYTTSNVDSETVVMGIVMLAVILLAGYLIIYNIFYINVFSDIRFYGLLKTIGTTERQLRQIVRRQAYFLCAVGIPLGLLAGYGAGAGLLPVVMSNLTYNEAVTSSASVNPWIFVGAAVFSFVTVYISCIRPCRIAAKVSPVEAVRYTEGASAVKAKKKGKKTRKISMHSFALENLKRNKKKTVLVVLSLSVSLILLNSVYSILKGFDMDKYVASRSVSDFMVADATVDNPAIYENVIDGVTKEIYDSIAAMPEVEEMGSVYLSYRMPEFTEEEYAPFDERIWSRKDEIFSAEIAAWGDSILQELEMYEKENTVRGKIYGIDRIIFDKLEFVKGELDWEKFATGKYVVVNNLAWGKDAENQTCFYEPGEKVRLTGQNGEDKEYEVLAVANMPYAAEMQSYSLLEVNYMLPSEEFFWYEGEKQPMKTLFNVKDGTEERVESFLEEYTTTVNPDLTYISRESLLKEFQSLSNMMVIVGGLLTGVLALIGILNFVNTIVTGILSRKQEFAMLEAVGMTGKQLQQMLMWEGAYHALFTVGLSVLAGSILSIAALRPVGSNFFFFTWKFTVSPIILCTPVIFLVVLLVPVLGYRRLCRTSVVERIRTAE